MKHFDSHFDSHNPDHRLSILACLAFFALLTVGCGGPTERPAAESRDADAAASQSKTESGDGDSVEYEPAYPADVSTEGPTKADTAHHHDPNQDDDEHGHGDDHEHGDEEGDHPHGDGDPSH